MGMTPMIMSATAKAIATHASEALRRDTQAKPMNAVQTSSCRIENRGSKERLSITRLLSSESVSGVSPEKATLATYDEKRLRLSHLERFKEVTTWTEAL